MNIPLTNYPQDSPGLVLFHFDQHELIAWKDLFTANDPGTRDHIDAAVAEGQGLLLDLPQFAFRTKIRTSISQIRIQSGWAILWPEAEGQEQQALLEGCGRKGLPEIAVAGFNQIEYQTGIEGLHTAAFLSG